MSIEEKIKQIANERFPEMPFVFDDWRSVDEQLERLPLPAIVLILPFNGSTYLHNSRSYDTSTYALAFLDADKRDANGEDNGQTYTRMKEIGTQFLQEINKSGYFAPLEGEIPYSVVCEHLSVIVTGIVYSVTLKQIQGICK